MAKNVCDILNESLYGTSAHFEDFRPALVANCVFNSFLSYTNIFLNIITIHAIRKTALLPKLLRTLLLSLVATDVGVGLLVQPLYNDFVFPQLVFEPCYILLEDEIDSSHSYGHNARHRQSVQGIAFIMSNCSFKYKLLEISRLLSHADTSTIELSRTFIKSRSYGVILLKYFFWKLLECSRALFECI